MEPLKSRSMPAKLTGWPARSDRSQGTPLPPTSCQVVDEVICRLQSHIFKSRSLLIAGAGRERCRPDFVVTRLGYPCFTLEFVASGKGSIKLGDDSRQLLPGHFFLYGPGIPLEVRTDPHAPMLKYYIEFFGGNLATLFSAGIIHPGQIRRVAGINHIADLFDHLIAAAQSTLPAQQMVCAAYLNLILAKSVESAPEMPGATVQCLENLRRCRVLVEKNFQRIPNLKVLSQMAHLDPSYISRLFKQFGLPSPHRYIEFCRMQHAVKLLLVEHRAVKEVAFAIGYLDPLHFSRNFRRHFGCTPSEFISRGRPHS